MEKTATVYHGTVNDLIHNPTFLDELIQNSIALDEISALCDPPQRLLRISCQCRKKNCATAKRILCGLKELTGPREVKEILCARTAAKLSNGTNKCDTK